VPVLVVENVLDFPGSASNRLLLITFRRAFVATITVPVNSSLDVHQEETSRLPSEDSKCFEPVTSTKIIKSDDVIGIVEPILRIQGHNVPCELLPSR